MSNKLIYWSPRILSILLIAFLTIFSFDVFSEDYSFWETILAFIMHNIPVFVLTLVLILAWKHELIGTAVFAAAAIFYMYLSRHGEDNLLLSLAFSLILAGPTLLIALLFFMSWKRKRKELKKLD